MANSSRLEKNRNGQMLIPMNVDSNSLDYHFINSAKLCILIVMLFFNGGLIAWANNSYFNISLYILLFIFLFIVDTLVLRYAILEEKYYYRMYKKMKQFEISTPSVFWNIVSMKDTEDGTILVYSDGKVGVVVKLERDTIIGKDDDFEEIHYDAISDFYKELNLKNLKYVQLNIMEQAGKDPRLQKLDELVAKTSNKNIARIVESQVGYIKRITRATLFETDYFLIYSDNINSTDVIIQDTVDCVYKILSGGFIGFSILNSDEILELFKDENNVKYFDYTEATVNVYKNYGINIPKAFDIKSIQYDDNTTDDIDSSRYNKLVQLLNKVNKGEINIDEYNIKETLRETSVTLNKAYKGVQLTDDIKKDTDNIIEDIDNNIFEIGDEGTRVEKIIGDVIDDIIYKKEE